MLTADEFLALIVPSLVALFAGLGFIFAFMNHKIKETGNDIGVCQSKREEFVQKEPTRIWDEFKKTLSTLTIPPEHPGVSQALDTVKSLSKNIENVKSALDHVEAINKAPQQIYQSMRTFRDYVLVMFVLLWTTILFTIVALLGGFDSLGIFGGLEQPYNVVFFLVLYPIVPFLYGLLRRKLIVPRETWKRLNKMLVQEGFKQPTALTN